jgi:hypothetical protein
MRGLPGETSAAGACKTGGAGDEVDDWLGRIGYKPDGSKQRALPDPDPALWFASNPSTALRNASNPWIVKSVADLASIFGLFFWVYLIMQSVSALLLARLAQQEEIMSFITAAPLLLALGLVGDWVIYRCLRGSAFRFFFKPAAVWALITIVPGPAVFILGKVGGLLAG